MFEIQKLVVYFKAIILGDILWLKIWLCLLKMVIYVSEFSFVKNKVSVGRWPLVSWSWEGGGHLGLGGLGLGSLVHPPQAGGRGHVPHLPRCREQDSHKLGGISTDSYNLWFWSKEQQKCQDVPSSPATVTAEPSFGVYQGKDSNEQLF